MNGINKDAIKIAEDILQGIKDSPFTISNLRSFFLLVDMLKMKDYIEWANNELYGYSKIKDCPPYRKAQHKYYPQLFDPITDEYILIIMYAENRTTKYRKNNNNIIVNSDSWIRILNNVDNKIYQTTSKILYKLKFEKMESDIFEEARKTVDKKLNDLCPKALEKLTEIYIDTIESKSKLDLQQIAYGCRVVMTDFADVVYPATKEKKLGYDEKEHDLGKNNYINRIIAFVQENIDSKSDKEFMKSHLIYLASFLNNVFVLANTGTHTEITQEQANRCVIYTYLALGDIINLCSV
jgi:hypothetical protein